jgi:hypothetical protein
MEIDVKALQLLPELEPKGSLRAMPCAWPDTQCWWSVA